MRSSSYALLAAGFVLGGLSLFLATGYFSPGRGLLEPAGKGGMPHGTGTEPAGEDDQGNGPESGGQLPSPSGELEVALLDGSGMAVSGAALRLQSRTRRAQAVTDTWGRATFTGLREGAYKLRLRPASGPELATAAAIKLAAGERKELVLKLPELQLAVAGSVLTKSGAPIAGIRIEAGRLLLEADETLLQPAALDAYTQVSDADGHFEIRGLEDGAYELRTAPTKTYPSVRMVIHAGVEGVELILEEGRWLKVYGKVTGREGGPLEGAEIQTYGEGGPAARSGEDGAYALELLVSSWERPPSLKFHLDGYRDKHVAIRAGAAGGSEWRLDAQLELSGLRAPVAGTILTHTSARAAGETVSLQSPSLQARLRAVSDASGRFLFTEVEPGDDYHLSIEPLGEFKDVNLHGLSVPPAGLELELVLEPLAAGDLRGQMVDSLGSPVPGFSMWLTNTKALGKSVEVVGDEAGRFELKGVAAGSLVLETKSMPRFTVRDFELPKGETKLLEIVLDVGAFDVEGTVSDATGSVVAGARVELYWTHHGSEARAGSYRKTSTDGEGRYQFTQLGSGLHKIRVSSPAHNNAEFNFEVAASMTLPPVILSPLAPERG